MALEMSIVSDASQLRAGSLLEFEMSVEDKGFQAPDLRAPLGDGVFLVEARSLPFERLGSGAFLHRWEMVYQVAQPGSLTLEGGRLVWADERREAIEPVELFVGTSDFAASSELLGMPEGGGNSVVNSWRLYIWGIVGILAITGIAIWSVLRNRRLARREGEVLDESSNEEWAALALQLESGSVGPESALAFFEDKSEEMSSELSARFSEYLYSRVGDAERLAAALREEAKR